MVYFGLGCVGNMVGVGTARQVCRLLSCRALGVCVYVCCACAVCASRHASVRLCVHVCVCVRVCVHVCVCVWLRACVRARGC